MGSENRILIACRYVPHDQWFLTNTSPSWKIKHLKQSIIAKALDLPFDRRLLMENPTARPPSPITFAPIQEPLQESGFSTGPGSCEVDKTHSDYRVEESDDGGNLTNDFGVAGPLSDSGRDMSTVEPSFAEYKSQIYSSVFTLIRFSTGQILEEHFLVSWYNLESHELVELHCSSPPTTFSRGLFFGHMILNGGSLTVGVPVPSQSTIPNSHASSSSTPPTVSATLSLSLAEPLRLTCLPRNDLTSYTEPYWEGWIRILRVMWQSDFETIPQANGLNDTRTKVKEWRERWAVIRNGVLSLCKKRDDPICTRLSLSALVSLCGAEYFSSDYSGNNTPLTNPAAGGPGGGSYKRSTPFHSNLTPAIRASRTAPISDSSRVINPVEDLGTWKYMSTATSNSATAPRVLSPIATQSNLTAIEANKNLPLMTTIDSIHFNHDYNTPVSVDPERSRRERAAVREWERERMQKELAGKSRLDKQIENTRWDDFVGFGGKSKAKSKEKEKEKERDNEKGSNRIGKVSEEKEQKTRKNSATILARHLLIGEGGPEKDKDCNRGDRQREKLQHHQDHLFHPDDHYIPASREDAIACGMLIVCAKFRIGVMEPMSKDRNENENSALDLLQDIGLDSSVAGNESGRNDGWMQGDMVERKAEGQQSQDLKSPLVVKSLPPSRKASLPGLGNGLTMLTSGRYTTPVGSMSGDFFGNKGRDNDKVDENDKQDGSYLEVEVSKAKQYSPPPTGHTTLRGMLDDYHGPSINPLQMEGLEWLNSVSNETPEKQPGLSPSPKYVNDRRFDSGQGDKGRCQGYEPDGKHTEQANRKQRRKRRDEDRVEWVVMDLGTEIAYNSFLRILHRHSPPPTQSSFIPVSASPFQSPNPLHDVVPNIRGVLPYPEWRRDVVFRARSHGMRELGRPLELSFNLETQADQARKSRNEHGSLDSNRRRKNNMSEIDHGSDNDHDNTLGMEYLMMLDDSDDGSEDESAQWWKDIPRQLTLEGNHPLKWSTTRHRHSWSGADENEEEYSPLSPNMPFTEFTFSPSHTDFSESTLSSPVLLDMEERLRPSISSSTLASNDTMSSFGASSSNLKNSIRSVMSNEEMDAVSPTGIPYSPGSYQSCCRRQIVSPSRNLSSPSSNESLSSYLPNAYRQLASGSASTLHHSASMPNASTWGAPHTGRGIQSDVTREQTVTAPNVPSLQKSILSTRRIQLVPVTPHDDPQAYDDFCANVDALDRPILTPAQIHQIETETEARISGDSMGPTRDTSSPCITDSATKRKLSTPVFNESPSSSTFPQEQMANNRYGDNTYSERNSRSELPREAAICFENSERGDGPLARNNVTRRFMTAGATRSYPTSPYSFYQDYMGNASSGSGSDSASISAKAILRRVRSGSSLQTPMGVHIEESEEDGRVQIYPF